MNAETRSMTIDLVIIVALLVLIFSIVALPIFAEVTDRNSRRDCVETASASGWTAQEAANACR